MTKKTRPITEPKIGMKVVAVPDSRYAYQSEDTDYGIISNINNSILSGWCHVKWMVGDHVKNEENYIWKQNENDGQDILELVEVQPEFEF